MSAVFTRLATNVAFGDALLTGALEGEGTLQTTAWFEYGTNGAFGLATPVQVFPPGMSLTPVTALVTPLAGGVLYNFRLAATNANGTNYGEAQTFFMPFPAAGNAVNLNGSYVQVGSDSVLKVTTNLTIEAWINSSGPGNGASGSGGVIAGREGEYLLAALRTEPFGMRFRPRRRAGQTS